METKLNDEDAEPRVLETAKSVKDFIQLLSPKMQVKFMLLIDTRLGE